MRKLSKEKNKNRKNKWIGKVDPIPTNNKQSKQDIQETVLFI